ELQNQNTQTSLINKTTELMQKMMDLTLDEDGLRITASGDNARYGDFMKAFAAQLPAVANAGDLMVKTSKTLNVSAANVGPGSTGNSGPSQAINGVPVTAATLTNWIAKPGDVIAVQVSGQWAPTCALSKLQLPGGEALGVVDGTGSPVLTGSEGYLAQAT